VQETNNPITSTDCRYQGLSSEMPDHPDLAQLPTEHTHSTPTLPRVGWRGAGLTMAEGGTREDT